MSYNKWKAAFNNCENLASVIFDDGSQLETIDWMAFYRCIKIDAIEIPASVKALGADAFKDWTAEQTIYVKGFSSEAEADTAWGIRWREYCNATIIYQG